MNFKVSVIIPTYNAENVIVRTIKSIQKQTIGFENIELIIVDDNSNDSTKSILKEYESTNVRLRVVYNSMNFYLTTKMENYCKITEESFYSKKENYIIHFKNNTFKLSKYSIEKLLERQRPEERHDAGRPGSDHRPGQRGRRCAEYLPERAGLLWQRCADRYFRFRAERILFYPE